MRIGTRADDTVQAALARIGRTEDVAFSPGGRRIAVAALLENRILLVDIECDFGDAEAPVRLSRAVEIGSAALSRPHGLAWIGDACLAVANREGAVTLFAVPPEGTWPARMELDPVLTIGGQPGEPVITPGSLSAFDLGAGLVELLVCNNYVHTVSRHLLDLRGGFALLATDLLLTGGIDVPDGVAHGRSGRWLAVSNHFENCVNLYRNTPDLGPGARPSAVLNGLRYPHGLRFTDDERTLIVADSGAPFLHVYHSESGDWEDAPAKGVPVRVLTDDEFERGRTNPEEGGPKGVDFSPDRRLLVLTCEQRPLVFLDAAQVVGPLAPAPGGPLAPAEQAERGREALLRFVAGPRRIAEAAIEESRTTRENLERMLASRSWWITTPLRRLGAALRRL